MTSEVVIEQNPDEESLIHSDDIQVDYIPYHQTLRVEDYVEHYLYGRFDTGDLAIQKSEKRKEQIVKVAQKIKDDPNATFNFDMIAPKKKDSSAIIGLWKSLEAYFTVLAEEAHQLGYNLDVVVIREGHKFYLGRKGVKVGENIVHAVTNPIGPDKLVKYPEDATLPTIHLLVQERSIETSTTSNDMAESKIYSDGALVGYHMVASRIQPE